MGVRAGSDSPGGSRLTAPAVSPPSRSSSPKSLPALTPSWRASSSRGGPSGSKPPKKAATCSMSYVPSRGSDWDSGGLPAAIQAGPVGKAHAFRSVCEGPGYMVEADDLKCPAGQADPPR